MRLSSPFRSVGLKTVLCGVLACLPVSVLAAGPADAWHASKQMVVVITPDWNATQGQLTRFERDGTAGWRQVEASAPIAVGRNGSAWGIGLHPEQSGDPRKQEGDGRAPAGVFALGDAFGYAATLRTGLVYAPMQASHWCIDVPASPLYNRIVDSRETGEAAVQGSTEPMRRDLHADGDVRYKEGFVILHNPGNVAGAGSCIFAHLWKAPGEPTAGCTAMAEPVMDRVIAWLDRRQQPVFVLLPQAEYERLATEWALPQMQGAAQ